ncbi:MAG TPA: hypothetical protein VLW85_00585 [Myxococcales bacterium]|nr:hypothetical protein [Myxococcales bacterium]
MRATIFTALCAGAALGLIAGAGCSAQQCKDMKGSGSPFASLLCGGEGTPAPEPTPNLPSACQPRAVMPQFFALIDNQDPSLAGLRAAVGDLGAPICLDPGSRVCTADTACAIGSCDPDTHLCPCQTSYSPLGDVLGVTLRGLATIADDKPESSDTSLPLPRCLSVQQAQDLPDAQRNRMCELRRTLDVLLNQNGGNAIIGNPDVRKVVLSLLDYVQGKTDGQTHYDLLTPLGRMAAADSATCDPAALWTLLDTMLGYLTPATATTMLGNLQTLLADPYTKSFLSNLTQNGGTSGRDSMILLVHGLSPAITGAASGADALAAINKLLDSLVYGSSSVPQQFKDEVKAVMDSTSAMLADQTGIFPPLQKLVACAGSPQVRCIDPSSCTNHDDQLIGALYDILSRSEAQGGVDLATLVGALKALTTADQTGEVDRALRMIIQGIEGSPDPTAPHDARDAVAQLAKDALTADEGQKLLPALSVLIENQVVPEFLGFMQDLLYTCKPPAQ